MTIRFIEIIKSLVIKSNSFEAGKTQKNPHFSVVHKISNGYETWTAHLSPKPKHVLQVLAAILSPGSTLISPLPQFLWLPYWKCGKSSSTRSDRVELARVWMNCWDRVTPKIPVGPPSLPWARFSQPITGMCFPVDSYLCPGKELLKISDKLTFW